MAKANREWRPRMPATLKTKPADGNSQRPDRPDDRLLRLLLGGVRLTHAEIDAGMQIQVELARSLKKLGPVPKEPGPHATRYFQAAVDAIEASKQRQVELLGIDRYLAIVNASGAVSRTRGDIEMSMEAPPPGTTRH
jgi:hypothetical protein